MNSSSNKQALTVLALGGNALGSDISVGERLELRAAARAIAAQPNRNFVITHGNGPQIGLLAQCRIEGHEQGLDVLGAETEGLLGYLVEQELSNEFPLERRMATLLTRVEVDPDDPAFRSPDKPVGSWLDEDQMRTLAANHGWVFQQEGTRYRRVVPSPRPLRILQQDVIRSLVADEVTVICSGGGGVPVARTEAGRMEGVEAVIDKDYSSALLASELQADMLILATDIDGVYRNWRQSGQEKLDVLSPEDVAALDLSAGSMRPKVLAASEFVKATGNPAVIGALSELASLLDGQAGTLIRQ